MTNLPGAIYFAPLKILGLTSSSTVRFVECKIYLFFCSKPNENDLNCGQKYIPP